MRKHLSILLIATIILSTFLMVGFRPTPTPTPISDDQPTKIGALELPSLTAVDDDEEKGIIYWQKRIFGSANGSEFVGEPVEVLGFVQRKEGDSKDVFFVSRRAVFCCVNEAEPQGLGVYLKNNRQYKDDEWVIVSGKWAQVDFDGTLRNLIIPEKIEKTEAPEDPFIYPGK